MTVADLCRLHPTSKTLLLHLENHGTISPAEAQTVYGLPKVARQVWELRQSGMRIGTTLRRDATGKRYARYSLQRD